MRTLSIVLVAATLSLAACKKKDAKPTPSAGPGSAVVAAGPGSAAGTGTGGSGSAGPGSAAPDPTAIDPSMSNKAGNCPSAVAGAKSEMVEDPANVGMVVLSIVAKDPNAVSTIRKRAAHLVAVQNAPDAEIKHSGEGTGGGAGICPVVTSKDVVIAVDEIPNGVQVKMKPSGAVTAADLSRDVMTRLGKMDGYNDFKPTDASGDGGGEGGGSGTHGGNHSGEGDGKGKEREQAKGSPPPT
jgi:hypothetical protein